MKNKYLHRVSDYDVLPFSERLKMVRRYKKMTQRQFGLVYGCDQSQVSRYENGLEPVGVTRFVAIVNFMYKRLNKGV